MASPRHTKFAGQLGDMHFAAVAGQEIMDETGEASIKPVEVALRLHWTDRDHRADIERATTALLAACEHRLIEPPG